MQRWTQRPAAGAPTLQGTCDRLRVGSRWTISGGLTVKLSGRAEAPDGRRGRTLSSRARGAQPPTHHGPLQRLLGGASAPESPTDGDLVKPKRTRSAYAAPGRPKNSKQSPLFHLDGSARPEKSRVPDHTSYTTYVAVKRNSSVPMTLPTN